jgi:hypothetical protein
MHNQSPFFKPTSCNMQFFVPRIKKYIQEMYVAKQEPGLVNSEYYVALIVFDLLLKT